MKLRRNKLKTAEKYDLNGLYYYIETIVPKYFFNRTGYSKY
ncbi:hypothetical protein P689_12233 [Candidatus Riesia pediculischaeffi PTSU]|uniref:Uncharacterized protein n=1 Tax=Candidatus Riesia pediculischaeffi PTSU TaxID=1401651 RepID=A0A0C1V620_9ENTR|nr:hypothetical protein P689_12233 [Candidatus Riesia pediculischaeffi PTSU]